MHTYTIHIHYPLPFRLNRRLAAGTISAGPSRGAHRRPHCRDQTHPPRSAAEPGAAVGAGAAEPGAAVVSMVKKEF